MVASPRIGPQVLTGLERKKDARHEMPPSSPDDLLDVALKVQNAHDLESWWQLVTNSLEERFDTIRAELVIPLSGSESESKVKPWAQLASFTRSSGSIQTLPKPYPANANVPVSGKQSRPKIGSRHSFQGYPLSPSTADASPARPNNPTVRRPGMPRTTSSENATHKSALPRIGSNGGMLSPTSLKRHFLEPQDTYRESIRSYDEALGDEGAKVFPCTRSLDTEPRALLTRTNVAKCLEKGQLFSESIEDNGSVVYVPLIRSSSRSSARRRLPSRQQTILKSTHSPKVSVSGFEDRPGSPSLESLQEERSDPSAILSILSGRRMSPSESSEISSIAPFLASSLVNMRRISQLESQASRAREEAEKKMHYLHTMSHELRTPLNGMIGNMQLMLNSILNDHQQDWVHGALNAARGMNEILNDVLDIAKAEARMLTLSHEWFRIRSTMEEVVETLGSKANEKRLELCYELHDNVPIMVKGDSMRIRQVLLNLVGNAIKFTRRGEIYFDCKVADEPADKTGDKKEQPERTLIFRVVDSGCGFSDENAKLLFKPYSQINNSATRANKGTGLGLTLCKQMVELHGGHISATSRGLGQGSTFTFTARFRLPSGKDHPDFIRTLSQSPRFRVDSLPNRALMSSPDPLSIDTVADVASYMDLPARPQLLISKSESLLGPLAMSFKSKDTAQSKDVPSRTSTPKADSNKAQQPSYDILIVCPQEHTLRTTKAYIEQVLPKSIPSKITTSNEENIKSSVYLGQDILPFSHVVLQLLEAEQVLAYMDSILGSVTQQNAFLLVVTDQEQELVIKQRADHDYTQLEKDHRLTFILKPTKPPKFARIFDPQGQSATGLEYNKTRSKQSKTQAYQQFKEKLGPLRIRALAVEDNSTNMKVRFSTPATFFLS